MDDLMYILSSRQLMYLNYIIKKLGFQDDDFQKKYLLQLAKSASKFNYLGALPDHYEEFLDEKGNKDYQIKGKNKFREYKQKHGLHIPINYNIIDFLNDEYLIKKNDKISLKKLSDNYISATDISNFTYCPVNYSISKTFEVVKPESAYLGEELHQDKRLINFISKSLDKSDSKNQEIDSMSFYSDLNKLFFNDIYVSELIYQGHSENESKKYFKSSKGNFVGQPDYIFKNSDNCFFVVEEKFQFQDGTAENKFHSNHINQTISYLHGITDYEIEYGYLVYWKFDLNYGSPNVHSCYVKKIIKSKSTLEHITDIYSRLKAFTKEKSIDFDVNKRNPQKCANCVSSMLCGHKTGNFNSLTIPYSRDYLKTHFIVFPKELKKDYVPEDKP